MRIKEYSSALILIATLTGCVTMPTGKISKSGKEMIIQQCKDIEKKLNCRIALAFEDLQTGKKINYRATEVYHPASLMKVPVMIEVFKQIDEGKFKLEDTFPVHKDFVSIASGKKFDCDGYKEMESLVGKDTTCRRLIELMIQVSDNLATNLLVEKVGAKNITQTIKKMGTKHTLVKRGVQDLDAFAVGMNNQTCALDMTLLMKQIAKGKVVNSIASREMMDILLGQEYNTLIPKLLPQTVKVAHKTGSIEQIEHDSAIIIDGDKSYVLTLLSDKLEDMNAGKEEIANLSLSIYNLWKAGKLAS